MPLYGDMMTSDQSEIKNKLLGAMLRDAGFDGWTDTTLRRASEACGLGTGGGALYFPGGPIELIEYWNAQMDRSAADDLSNLDLGSMRIRDKVTAGVLARMMAIGPHEEAARRAIARNTLPGAAGLNTRIAWRAADTIWRAIGDGSTDFNFYSKRAILSGVIASTAVSWLADSDPNKAKARAFLGARIANVMQFETAKFKVKNQLKSMPDPLAVLGELRFGRRRRRRG